ncbi:zinc metallopeptidase [Helcococcus kunzii]|uniref:zinc metallopeptidase n=1 Tax=Helcococcus kunzii TaxID=40091 RepID=UPI0024AD4612|nr:zinc metallopeptidase [Helcococcus kunzii]
MYLVYYSRGVAPSTYILLLLMIGLSMWASYKVTSNFDKYSDEISAKGMTGAEVAQLILNRNGINDVTIQPIAGKLTDHYDPRNKTLRLSEEVYGKRSISAISVAAHEVGHAIQHNESYAFLKFRSLLAPVVSFTSNFVMMLIILGFIIQMSGLINLGIALYALSVLFHIVTLPVEFDASRRALINLEQNSILTRDEEVGSKSVLRSAAMTYVASALVSVVQLLRLMGMRRD